MELCEDSYVQKMTFDSYLYKTVVPGNPLDDVKLLVSERVGHSTVGLGSIATGGTRFVPDASSRGAYRIARARPGIAEAHLPRNLQSTCADALHPVVPLPLHPQVRTVSSILRSNALRSVNSKSVNVSFGSKANEERVMAA